MKSTLHFLLAAGILAFACRLGGAATANAGATVNLEMDNVRLNVFIKDLQSWTGKQINVPAEVLAVSFKSRIRMQNVPKAEVVALFRELLEKSAGVIFEDQPDGAWQARLIARDRDPDSESLVVRNVTPATFLGERTGLFQAKNYEVSYGVLKNSTKLNLAVYNVSHEQLDAQLRDALEKQADIVADLPGGTLLHEAPTSAAMSQKVAQELPDGTLRLRLKTGDNDPMVPALDFKATPVDTVLAKIHDITGENFVKTSNPLPSGPHPSPFSGAITLHVESAPTSKVDELLRDALERQAGVVLRDYGNPFPSRADMLHHYAGGARFILNARLAPAAAPKT